MNAKPLPAQRLRVAEARVPANELDAEGVVLSAAILDGRETLAKLRPFLLPFHFFADANRLIYQAVLDIDAAGSAIDLVAIARQLRRQGRLDQAGGKPYLALILEATPAAANVVEHARAIREAWRRREAAKIGQHIAISSGADVGSLGEYLSEAARQLTALVDPGERSAQALSADAIFEPLPPMRYIVQAIDLCPGAPGMWAGFGYSKKTIAAQAACLQIAAGLGKVWGCFSAAPGRVLHIDYEQGNRLTRERYQRLAMPLMLGPSELADRLVLITMPRLYLDAQGAEEELARLADGFDLVLIDSLRAAAPNIEENSSDARRPLDMLSRVSERTGAAFLVIHHARKPNQAQAGGAKYAIRGSGALFDACGSVLLFSGEKDQPSLVTHEKARASGLLTDDFEIDVADVPDGANPRAGVLVTAQGAMVRAGVRDAVAEEQARLGRVARNERLADELRALFRREPDQGGADSICAKLGRKRDDVRTALALLVSGGEVQQVGKTRDRRHVWAGA